MSISSIVGRILPTATAFVSSGGNPFAATAAFVQADKARDAAKKARLENEKIRSQYMEYFGNAGSSIPTIQQNLAATTPRVSTASSGGGFFDTVRSGLREVGGFVGDVFASGIPQLFGVSRPPSVGQQPALTTVTNIGAQESQGSGSIQAGAGSLLAPVISGARSFLKSPQGQLALGGGAGIVTRYLRS